MISCLRPYAANKFAPRSSQCIFLGYNAQSKGYRCFHLASGRVYISRHVIFDKDLFPFRPQPSSHPPVDTFSSRSQWLYLLSEPTVVPQVLPSRSTFVAPPSVSVPPVGLMRVVSTAIEEQCSERTSDIDSGSIATALFFLQAGQTPLPLLF